jgi:hypothetical protein
MTRAVSSTGTRCALAVRASCFHVYPPARLCVVATDDLSVSVRQVLMALAFPVFMAEVSPRQPFPLPLLQRRRLRPRAVNVLARSAEYLALRRALVGPVWSQLVLRHGPARPKRKHGQPPGPDGLLFAMCLLCLIQVTLLPVAPPAPPLAPPTTAKHARRRVATAAAPRRRCLPTACRWSARWTGRSARSCTRRCTRPRCCASCSRSWPRSSRTT